MKTAGVIAEYNPFHSGHQNMLRQVREQGAEAIVVALSGNFVQRGEPALWSKFTRTRAALSGGADLVLELPLAYAVATAERFAFGGVSLLDSLGVLDWIAFGSESGSESALKEAAAAASDPKVLQQIPTLMQDGTPYAAARQAAVAECFSEQTAALFRSPNDVLGVEYLRQLAERGSPLQPLVIPRTGAGHDSLQEAASASASLIRQRFRAGNLERVRSYLPQSALFEADWAEGRCPVSEYWERAMLCALRSRTPEQLSALPDLSEGLENRLFRCIRQSCSMEELLSLLKTKRYPTARLRRLLLSAWLEIPADFCHHAPPYLRVLGATPRGLDLLSAAKKHCSVPISSSPARLAETSPLAASMIELEARADDLWEAVCRRPHPCGRSYTEPFLLVR